jgi:hypothetical protein
VTLPQVDWSEFVSDVLVAKFILPTGCNQGSLAAQVPLAFDQPVWGQAKQKESQSA